MVDQFLTLVLNIIFLLSMSYLLETEIQCMIIMVGIMVA
jgi:hypothetical protein